MNASLIQELYAGIPALAALVPAILLIHVICRRHRLRRLRLALTLLAFAGSLAVFHRLAPTLAGPVKPYLWLLTTFALVYFPFKLTEVLLFDVLAPRRGQSPPPGIFRDIVSAAFAVILLIVLIQRGFDVHVATLVVTSAALSVFLGLALQQTVTDLFSGLALMIERPFEPGDWVKIGQRIGQVKEISWRAVKIKLLRLEDYLIIPNSVVAKTEIVNMSSPTHLHGQSIEVSAAYHHPPNKVREVLIAAARDASGVLPQPQPLAELLRFDSSAIVYRLTYWIDDYPRTDEIEAELQAHIWYAFRRHGIEIPFPIQQTYIRRLAEVGAVERRAQVERAAALLGRVDFLSALKPDDISRLAETARLLPYPAGAVVARKGDSGDSLFVVASGRIELLDELSGRTHRIDTRDVGEYFGEMSLLTGVPRPATVRAAEDAELLMLSRDTLRPILQNDPAAVERLSCTLTSHKAMLEQATQRLAAEGRPSAAESHPDTLIASIRRFFGVGEPAP